jgi:hypothetical protein
VNCFKLIVAGFALQALFCGYAAARNESVEHTLTVTAVVQSSVALTVDGEGNPKLIVANAPTSGDNVSRLNVISAQKSSLLNVKTVSAKNSGDKNVQIDQSSHGCASGCNNVSGNSGRPERTHRN